MRDRLIFTGQLLFTLLVAAFLVVPAVLSISAGVTVNYFRGIQSGVTLQWVVQVWDLYADTILLSFVIAFATLVVTLVVGVPAAYALHVRGGRLSRIVEEIITLPLAIPGLAIALALLLTYGGFGGFPPLLAVHPDRACHLHHAVHGAIGDGGIRNHRHQDAGRRRGFARRFAVAPLPRRDRSQRRPGILAGCVDGGHAVARRIQPDLDAAYAADQDACRSAWPTATPRCGSKSPRPIR